MGDWIDAFPRDVAYWRDFDQDGIADEGDLDDGLLDGDPGEWVHCTIGFDIQGDWKATDRDTDGDGVVDADAFPLNADAHAWSTTFCVADDPTAAAPPQYEPPSESAASEPAEPNDTAPYEYENVCTEGGLWGEELSAEIDQDGDGYVDSEDQFPLNAYEFADTDYDCIGDNADAFPDDGSEWADTDLDGFGDGYDAFPLDPLENMDRDGDGIGDNADPDDDNDGYLDDEDDLPFNPDEWLDSDVSGVGDNADPDDDNDGYWDDEDLFPFDADEWFDTDGDGIGDNADPDADGDGIANEEDGAPLDPTRWEAGEWDEFMTGDPELDALMLEILSAGEGDYTSSTATSSYGTSSSLYGSSYGSGSSYPYTRTSYPSSSGSSGPSLRALKFMILLPLLAIRWAMRSGDK